MDPEERLWSQDWKEIILGDSLRSWISLCFNINSFRFFLLLHIFLLSQSFCVPLVKHESLRGRKHRIASFEWLEQKKESEKETFLFHLELISYPQDRNGKNGKFQMKINKNSEKGEKSKMLKGEEQGTWFSLSLSQANVVQLIEYALCLLPYVTQYSLLFQTWTLALGMSALTYLK